MQLLPLDKPDLGPHMHDDGMDAWMDGSMNEGNACMNGWSDACMNRRMNKLMHGWMDERMNANLP